MYGRGMVTMSRPIRRRSEQSGSVAGGVGDNDGAFAAGLVPIDRHTGGFAEVGERPQRYPRQQERPDEGRAAYDVHHLLTAQSAEDGVGFRRGDELAHETIFEASYGFGSMPATASAALKLEMSAWMASPPI